MLVGCQIINVYDLHYSENPFDCPEILVGVGVSLALLALGAIAAICCYTCGKYRKQREDQQDVVKQGPVSRRLPAYQRISKIIPWRYLRMQRDEEPNLTRHTNKVIVE